MPRDLPLSNGKLLVNFDQRYNLRDIFYPSIGQENQTAGEACRVGVWADGRFSWLDSADWIRTLEYGKDTLATDVELLNSVMNLQLTFNDAVDLDRSLFLRRVKVSNLLDASREVRLFFHYDFHIYGVGTGDTLYYDPSIDSIIAYKGRRFFVLDGMTRTETGVYDWAIGQTEMRGLEGTWKDAEDGRLERNPIAQGSVDTTLGFYLMVPARGEELVYHWLGAAINLEEVKSLDRTVRERGPSLYINRTADYWRAWLDKEDRDLTCLPPSVVDLYRRSLLTIRTHCDSGGGIISSTDWDVISYNRDTYCYVWPRDGSTSALALSQAGYSEIARAFFRFCAKVITPQGYMMHKYGPLGDVASSWHPWMDRNGRPQLPIQEDSTALVLHALRLHYQKWRDIEFITPLYRSLIKNAGDFLASFREPRTGLPAPSYDLWEERHGIHTFTVAAVWAGLEAAAYFAQLFNEPALCRSYKEAAEQIKDAATEHLFDHEKGHFSRSISVEEDGSITRDSTLDSSLCALFKFGMYQTDDPLIESTVKVLRDRLWCKTSVGGMARYQGDGYFQVSQDKEAVPGNPWFVPTLWLAQYYIRRARSVAELEEAVELLRWVEEKALPSGVLAEQLNPFSGEPLSVSPLIWSHAELVLTVLEYAERHKELSRGPVN